MKKIIKKIKLVNLSLSLILIVFLLGNYFINFLPWRIDLSTNKAYSLSKSTKKVLKGLKKPVEIKFFISSDLPTRLIPLKNDVVDFLKEYQKTSAKVSLKILDPKKDSKALEEVRNEGIPELQFSQLEQDKYEVKAVYFGMLIKTKEKKEIIPQVSDVESLEYNLTTAIYKITRERLEKIAIVGKKDEFYQENDDLSIFKKVLRQQYQLDFINIDKDSTIEKINKDYKTMIIFDTLEKNYQEEEIGKIKDYLDHGGKTVFFIDGVWVGESLYTTQANHNLFQLLKDWRLKLAQNLILSSSAEMVNFGNQNFQFITLYPYWIRTNNFNSKESLVQNLTQLTFPWVSSVDVGRDSNLETKIIVKSTKNSWEEKISTESAFFADPNNIVRPQPNQLKEFNLIALARNKKNQGAILLIPCSRFILDRYLSRSSDNLKFILNVLNEFASQGALSGIHQRMVYFYPLPEFNESTKDVVKYFLILLLPVLFGFYGLVRIFKRR